MLKLIESPLASSTTMASTTYGTTMKLVIMNKNYKSYNSNLMAANEVCMTSG